MALPPPPPPALRNRWPFHGRAGGSEGARQTAGRQCVVVCDGERLFAAQLQLFTSQCVDRWGLPPPLPPTPRFLIFSSYSPLVCWIYIYILLKCVVKDDSVCQGRLENKVRRFEWVFSVPETHTVKIISLSVARLSYDLQHAFEGLIIYIFFTQGKFFFIFPLFSQLYPICFMKERCCAHY